MPKKIFHAWLDYLETNLKVIVVTAPDDSNAFVIFETLNDRGLELAISDLLKNYLFHKSGEKIEGNQEPLVVYGCGTGECIRRPFDRHLSSPFRNVEVWFIREKSFLD